MESTFPHFQAQSSSLPSDYGLIARYTEARGPTTLNNASILDESLQEVRKQNTKESGIKDDNDEAEEILAVRRGLPADAWKAPSRSPQLPSEGTPLLAANESNDTNEPSVQQPDNNVQTISSLYWSEFYTLTKFALPVFGTHVLEYSLVNASVLFVGHLSTTALAAMTLGSMTASVSGLSIIQGLSSALDTMLPSAWTSSQPQLVGLWAHRMTVVMAVCLIPMFIVWFNAEGLLLLLKQDPEVAHMAAVYLRWVSLGLPAYAFNCISRRYFQSQGLFTIPTRIIILVAPINLLLNYLLVWGPEPIRLGFIGAPIAAAISYNLVALSSIIYGVYFVPRTAWHPICRRSFTHLGVLVHLGLAGVAQTASEWWAWELTALSASLISPTALATQSVLLVSSSTTFQAPFALGVAASVRIGNLLGEWKAKQAEIASNVSIIIAIIIACFNSALFLIFRNSWGYVFNDDPAVVTLVASILPLVALFQIFDGVAAVTAGVLRARGKQVTGAFLNLTSYYIIGIPLGVVLTFRYSMGLHGMWIGLTVSLIYCAVFGTWLCIRTNWDKEVQKVKDRLEKEQHAKVKHGHSQV